MSNKSISEWMYNDYFANLLVVETLTNTKIRIGKSYHFLEYYSMNNYTSDPMEPCFINLSVGLTMKIIPVGSGPKSFSYSTIPSNIQPLVFQPFVTLRNDGRIIELKVSIGKRNGQRALRIVNLDKHRHNRKPVFIQLGTDESIMQRYLRYKLQFN